MGLSIAKFSGVKKPTREEKLYAEAQQMSKYITESYSVEEQTEILKSLVENFINHKQTEIQNAKENLKRLLRDKKELSDFNKTLISSNLIFKDETI